MIRCSKFKIWHILYFDLDLLDVTILSRVHDIIHLVTEAVAVHFMVTV